MGRYFTDGHSGCSQMWALRMFTVEKRYGHQIVEVKATKGSHDPVIVNH